MGRSKFTFRHQLSAERSQEVAEKFLTENGLKFMTLKSGEPVWKYGTGLLISPSFVRLYYEDCTTTVLAWIQNGLGLTARSEGEVHGIGAMLPKRRINNLLKRLESELENADPGSAPEITEEEE